MTDLSKPPILTWLEDPEGNVWAVDAADVVQPAPDAIPTKQVDWDEIGRYYQLDSMAGAVAHFRWTLHTELLTEGGFMGRVAYKLARLVEAVRGRK